jgi:hypothetical protein
LRISSSLAVGGPDRNADRRADDAAAAVDRIRLRQARDDVGREVAKHRAIVAVAQDDLKFVSADPEDLVLVAHDPEQPRGHLLQKRIAGRMAQCVVDLLEAIEIDQHDGAATLLRLAPDEIGLEHLGHAQPVRKAGQ